MTDRLTELRALTRAATPGPWKAAETDAIADAEGRDLVWMYDDGRPTISADSRLIAAMRNVLPALLDGWDAAADLLSQWTDEPHDQGTSLNVAAPDEFLCDTCTMPWPCPTVRWRAAIARLDGGDGAP